MKFTKMQGCGNDYIYVNCFEENVINPNETAKRVSDVHFGIGSDGMILIGPSEAADFKMSMYNADGSEGKMCGNGIRCVAKYVYDFGLTDKTDITVETLSGIKRLKLNVENGKTVSVTVDMGRAVTEAALIPAVYEGRKVIIDEPVDICGTEYRVTCVSMGNPHCIVYVDNVKDIDIDRIGPMFESHPMFPERVNTEFIEITDRKNIKMRVWERGSGETFACGTGACASVAAGILNDKNDSEVCVHLLGGDLNISCKSDGSIHMTGPAEIICTGEIDIENGECYEKAV